MSHAPGPLPTRRAFLGGLSALAALTVTGRARALDRTPYGGTVRLFVPLSLDGLDPHSSNDAASALFADSAFDPLYAWDAQGRPYPALADGLPEARADGVRVALRPGLVTARGRPLDARDVLASVTRSRASGGAPLLAALPAPTRAPGDALGVVFRGVTAQAVADALASPMTAIVPRAFTPEEPDGTGAFRATRAGSGLVLERNERAARGAAFLDRVEVHRAPDLAGGLRSFESGDAEVGWLGAGLHRRRAGATDFRAAPRGFIVVRTGAEAGAWGAPGVAQRLVEGMAPDRLAHLALRPGGGGDRATWSGPPAEVIVDEASPYLVEVARVVAAAFGAPGHEIRPVTLPISELRARVQHGRFALAVDVVRRVGPSPRHTLLSLLAAADPRLAERPPRLAVVEPAAVARTLPLGVLGELCPLGAHVPDVQGLEAWDLGSASRARGGR